MKNWQPFIKAGFELVQNAKEFSPVFLEPDIEAYLVHAVARTIERTDIGSKPVAIQLLETQHIPKNKRKSQLQEIGEECLMMHAWEFKRRRWPSDTYYQDIGSIAYGYAAFITRPPDDLLECVSKNFSIISIVLRHVRDLSRI
jgi:hypothetical protein